MSQTRRSNPDGTFKKPNIRVTRQKEALQYQIEEELDEIEGLKPKIKHLKGK